MVTRQHVVQPLDYANLCQTSRYCSGLATPRPSIHFIQAMHLRCALLLPRNELGIRGALRAAADRLFSDVCHPSVH